MRRLRFLLPIPISFMVLACAIRLVRHEWALALLDYCTAVYLATCTSPEAIG